MLICFFQLVFKCQQVFSEWIIQYCIDNVSCVKGVIHTDSVCHVVLQVSEGDWKGEVPAPENVQIINYLNVVRPQPYDQQYISQAFDVASLLGQLKELGDDRISSGVRGIARAVAGLAPPGVNIARETVDRYRALLD